MLRLFSRVRKSSLHVSPLTLQTHKLLLCLPRFSSFYASQQRTPRQQKLKAIEQNKKITEFERKRDWKGLVQYVDETKNEFNDVNWATMFSKLGRMRREARAIKNDKVFNRVRGDFEKRLEDGGMGWLGIREAANVIHAHGVMGIRSKVVFKSLVDDTKRIVEEGDAHTISNCAYALARLGIRGNDFIQTLESEDIVKKLVREGKPQAIANTIWAMATLGNQAPTLARAIDTNEVAMKIVREGQPQAISNTIWALATLGHRAPTLARAIDGNEVVIKIVREGKPQNIANTIWAMATFGYQAPNLARAIDSEEVVMRIVREGRPQHMANTIWAMATLGVRAPTLARAIDSEEVVMRIVREGKPQAISNTIWAMATLGVQAPALARAINSVATMDNFTKEANMQHFSNSIWAMNQLKYDCPRLVQAFAVTARELMGTAHSQGISNTAFGLSYLGYFNEEIFEQIGKHADIVANGSKQDIANTLWAFGISGFTAKHEETVKMLWDDVMKRPVTQFSSEAWSQLEIARLFARSEGVDLEVIDDDGRGGSRREIMENAANVDDKPATRFERNIANDLARFGFSGFETEVSPFDNGEGGKLLKIDIAWKEEKVALELDGPTHFLSPSNKRDGPTKAKKRLLKSLGWKVLNISYMQNREFEKLREEEKKKALVVWLEKYGVKP
eukprot:CAMPEP_0118643390 /NCGR_PEP_ID=MMETSP0785-20121206/6366_1 /TAXON_ID=91992 /ORGANISM="Bolidomonas pacifica, Strain CCMP 1866" /LENGTH=675 /DNA_ID=CAMNT_0006535051 /DNA_START=153 /DNA_END=2176 /DNA_ORIENTATION=+